MSFPGRQRQLHERRMSQDARGVFGGTGRTMLEWVLTDGFLEQVIRNEQVRQDTRTRARGWP
jgi:hypothetical protein